MENTHIQNIEYERHNRETHNTPCARKAWHTIRNTQYAIQHKQHQIHNTKYVMHNT